MAGAHGASVETGEPREPGDGGLVQQHALRQSSGDQASGDNMTKAATMPETVAEPVDAPAGSYAYRPVRFGKGQSLYFFKSKTAAGERIR